MTKQSTEAQLRAMTPEQLDAHNARVRSRVSPTGRPIVTLTEPPFYIAAAMATRSGAAMTLRGWTWRPRWADDGQPGWRECKVANVVRVDTCEGMATVRDGAKVKLYPNIVAASQAERGADAFWESPRS